MSCTPHLLPSSKPSYLSFVRKHSAVRSKKVPQRENKTKKRFPGEEHYRKASGSESTWKPRFGTTYDVIAIGSKWRITI